MGFLLVFAAVVVGTVVQGSVGFGLALVLVPVLALIRPEVLPAAVLLLTMPMAAFMAASERRSVDVSGLLPILVGRFAGTLAGVGLLTLVPAGFLSALFGGIVLAAVLVSVSRPRIRLRGRTKFVGGLASGAMGTAGGIGGPPLALVYQERSGPEIRSTLAVAFAVGTTISLVALFLVGRVGGEHLSLTLQLLPALLLGLLFARWMSPLLDGRWTRPAILLFAAVCGIAAVLSAL